MESQLTSFKKKSLNQPVIIKKKIEPTADGKEIQRKQPILYTNTSIPVSRQLFEIIDCLKNETEAITNDDIVRKRAINILDTPKLLEAILQNDRIEYNPEKKTFKYKPIFNIRTCHDLLEILKQNRGITGMEVKELKNSYPGVVDLIEV